jgi:hypothetical protein
MVQNDMDALAPLLAEDLIYIPPRASRKRNNSSSTGFAAALFAIDRSNRQRLL